MLKQRDVASLAHLWPACLPGVQRTTKASLAHLWPACLPGVQRTTKASLAHLWPACLPGVQRTTKASLAHLWPACLCAWRAMHNQAHHESVEIRGSCHCHTHLLDIRTWKVQKPQRPERPERESHPTPSRSMEADTFPNDGIIEEKRVFCP